MTTENQVAEGGKEPGLRIVQIFLIAAHFEHREDVLSISPRTELGELSLTVSLQILNVEQQDPNEAGKLAGLILLAVATVPEEKPLYRLNVQLAALVSQTESHAMDPREYLTKTGAIMLFPFMREAVANLTMRGRFGPVWMKPINVAKMLVGGSVEPVSAPQPKPPDGP